MARRRADSRVTRFFLDFEASSLGQGSWPIEVAWVDEYGVSEAHMILPDAAWSGWSRASQEIHRIRLEDVHALGKPADFVAERIVACLRGHTVYSDAPAWDGGWLRMLLDAGGHDPRAVTLESVELACGEACRPLRNTMPLRQVMTTAQWIVADAELLEEARLRIRHRALPDAEALRWTWCEIRRRVAALTAK